MGGVCILPCSLPNSKSFQFLPIECAVKCGLFIKGPYCVEYFIPSLLGIFITKACWILSDAFFLHHLKLSHTFFLHSGNVEVFLCEDVKPSSEWTLSRLASVLTPMTFLNACVEVCTTAWCVCPCTLLHYLVSVVQGKVWTAGIVCPLTLFKIVLFLAFCISL